MSKGTETGLSLICLSKREKVSVGEAKWQGGSMEGEEVRDLTGATYCRALLTMVSPGFILSTRTQSRRMT